MHKKILIIDDSQSTRMLMKLFLKKEGFIVVEAADGKPAVELLKIAEDIDFIVTDINMPGMNGIDLIKIIRRMDVYKFSPILVMTSPDSPENRERVKAAGATAWIDKPFDHNNLIRIINKLSR